MIFGAPFLLLPSGESPASLLFATFGANLLGEYDPHQATLWQDAAGTVPATAHGDPVRRIDDLSGLDNHLLAPTDEARPTLYVSSGERGLTFSATTEMTSTNDVTWASQVATMALAENLSIIGATVAIAQNTLTPGSGSFVAGDFDHIVFSSDSANVRRARVASGASAFRHVSYSSTDGSTIRAIIQYSRATTTGSISVHENGSAKSLTLVADTHSGVGNIRTNPFYLVPSVKRLGRIALINRALTAGERTSVDAWLAA